MDFFDFFGLSGAEGTRRMRIFTGSIGALLGGIIGYFVVTELQAEPFPAFVNGAFAAVAGGGLGALFSAYVVLGLSVVLFVVAAVVWQIYFGGS